MNCLDELKSSEKVKNCDAEKQGDGVNVFERSKLGEALYFLDCEKSFVFENSPVSLNPFVLLNPFVSPNPSVSVNSLVFNIWPDLKRKMKNKSIGIWNTITHFSNYIMSEIVCSWASKHYIPRNFQHLMCL